MIIAIYSLDCDGTGCNATYRGPADVDRSWSALMASARSSGWLVRTNSGRRVALHLCPPCNTAHAADDRAARRANHSRGQTADRTARPAPITDEEI